MNILICSIFLLAPFLTIPLIVLGILKDKKNTFIYIVLLAILIAIVAYNFNPKQEQDLYRYNYLMEEKYSQLNLWEYFEIMFQNNKFIFTLLMYITAKIGNYSILPFICTFIGYFIVIYTIFDYVKIKKIQQYKGILILIAFICIFYFINFISGLAQFLATSISFLAFYLEYIKGKTKKYYKILYILPGFIHASMFSAIIIRILLNFKLKNTKFIIIPLFILYGLARNFIYNIVILFDNIPLISVLVSKAEMYLLDSPNTFYSIYPVTITLLVFCYLLIYLLTNKKVRETENEKFCDLIFIVLFFNICSIQYYTIFVRILDFSIILMNIYLIKVIEIIDKKNKIIIISLIIIFSLALGSVNFNLIRTNDFGKIEGHCYQNIFYFLSK